MSTYVQPQLTRQQLADTLFNFSIVEITEADLINPNPQLVAHLLTAILTSLGFLKEEAQYGQLDFGSLDGFDNPDDHIEVISLVDLFCKTKEVLSAIGSSFNLTMNDLMCPEPARTLKILSALTNFLMYKHDIMNNLEGVYNEVSSLEEKQGENETQIAQLNAEIAEYHKAREEQLPLVHEAEAKVKQLRQTIPELNKRQASLKNSLVKMKEKAKEMDEKISKAKFEVIQSEQEKSNLQSKIVQSPDKLQRALEEKKEMLVEAKSRQRLITQKFHEKSNVLEIYAKAYKKMSKNFTQTQALQEQMAAAKSIDKSVKQLKTKLEDDRVIDLSLEAKLVELQGRGKQLEEKRLQLEKEKNKKADECQKEMNKLKLDSESRKHMLEGKRREIQSIMTEVDSITSKIDSVKNSGAEVQRSLLQKAELVSNEMRKYWSSIEARIKTEGDGN